MVKTNNVSYTIQPQPTAVVPPLDFPDFHTTPTSYDLAMIGQMTKLRVIRKSMLQDSTARKW